MHNTQYKLIIQMYKCYIHIGMQIKIYCTVQNLAIQDMTMGQYAAV